MRGRRASCSWLRSGCQRDELRWCPPRERTRVPSGVVVAPLATDLDGTGADHPLGRIEGGAERHVLADETVPLGERMLEHLVGAPAFEHLPIQLRLHRITLRERGVSTLLELPDAIGAQRGGRLRPRQAPLLVHDADARHLHSALLRHHSCAFHPLKLRAVAVSSICLRTFNRHAFLLLALSLSVEASTR